MKKSVQVSSGNSERLQKTANNSEGRFISRNIPKVEKNEHAKRIKL